MYFIRQARLFIKIVNQTEINVSCTVTFSTASMLEWKAKVLKNKYCLPGGMTQFWKKGGDRQKAGWLRKRGGGDNTPFRTMPKVESMNGTYVEFRKQYKFH